MSKKILIFGLPGSGKTTLAKRLQKCLDCAWYNADAVREMANDWDFSPEGRLRQATRMRTIADFEKECDRDVICEFVAPTQHVRDLFKPDITIFMDTIEEGRFDDTNEMFERPIKDGDFRIIRFLDDDEMRTLAKRVGLML